MISVNTSYSVIACTKEPAELIPAFLKELEELQYPTAEAFKAEAEEALSSEEQAEEFADLLRAALTDCAGDGIYFGAHSDDDTDFGFWAADEFAFEIAA